MNILGISCYYHDSAACLISGEKVYAAQEERFNRKKHSQGFPVRAINFCLSEADITVNDLDIVVFYEKPFLKFWRVLYSFIESFPRSFSSFLRYMPRYLGERLILPIRLADDIDYRGKVLFLTHHMSHAASTFYASGFKDSAIITSDGIGEFTTLSICKGDDKKIKVMKEQRFPHSLGLVYSAFTSFLGFHANGGEGKVMALASYGKPVFKKQFEKLFHVCENGSFAINKGYFDFKSGNIPYTKKFLSLFGTARKKNDALTQTHFDIAATLQDFLEERMVMIANHAHDIIKSENLCLAGGVFLNCVMNRRIEMRTPFKNIFVQPSSGDSGGALGAALYIKHAINGDERFLNMKSADLGPAFSNSSIKGVAVNSGFSCEFLEEDMLLDKVCKDIKNGLKIGWFQGKMEFGPRALGHRSILANACIKDMREKLNNDIKHREWFRPYGISILKEHLSEYVDTNTPNNFMLNVGWVLPEKEKIISTVVHVDGSVRYQTVDEEDGIYYRLIKKYYELTGIPLIINTSFNNNNEPIVCSPDDAVKCFSNIPLDRLCMQNYYLSKDNV